MEEKIYGEQLEGDYTTSATDVGFDNVSPEITESSPDLGKFKSVEELIKSYNNLHSEFTKKCQAFNQLKKEIEDNVDNTPQSKDEMSWSDCVDLFLSKFPQAKSYSKQIAEVLASDKDLGEDKISLERAYSMVLETENKQLKNVVDNKNFQLEDIDENVREEIINNYLNKLNNYSPSLMMSKGGDKVITSYKKPSSMSEAGELAKKIFK